MSNPLVDMEKPEVIFCIGTNMTECHPVAATGIKKAVARGAKLIVGGSSTNQACRDGGSLSSAAGRIGHRIAARHGTRDSARGIDG